MINFKYVSWTENNGTYTINESNTKPKYWGDYANGEWANIKTQENGLGAYWVWIPRFEYVVPTSTTATEIEVRFISIDKKAGAQGYTTTNGVTIEPTVTSYLKNHNELNDVGGVEYLLQLSESVPTTAHSQYYLNILNEIYTKYPNKEYSNAIYKELIKNGVIEE